MRKLSVGGWIAKVYTLNAKDYGLPQTRTRIYIVVLPEPHTLPPTLPHWKTPPRFREFLDPNSPATIVSKMPASYKNNLRKYLKILKPKLVDKELNGTFATIDVSRNPGGYRGDVYMDCAPTITCRNTQVWIISLGQGGLDYLLLFIILYYHILFTIIHCVI